jgi:Na+/H+ antiporter NhaA
MSGTVFVTGLPFSNTASLEVQKALLENELCHRVQTVQPLAAAASTIIPPAAVDSLVEIE